jgi:hypothetical protein
MKNITKKCFLGIILIVVFAYILMIIDTHGLINRSKNIFLLKIPETEINDMLKNYSPEFFSKNGIGNIELDFFRLFTIHNFKKGIIIIKYTHVVYDTNGEILTGSWDIYPVIWKIEKINNVWNVVDIIEDP